MPDKNSKGSSKPNAEPNPGCISFQCTSCNGTGILIVKIRPYNSKQRAERDELRTCSGDGWDLRLYLASMPAELSNNEDKILSLYQNKCSIPSIADQLNLECSYKTLAKFIVLKRKFEPFRWRYSGS